MYKVLNNESIIFKCALLNSLSWVFDHSYKSVVKCFNFIQSFVEWSLTIGSFLLQLLVVMLVMMGLVLWLVFEG